MDANALFDVANASVSAGNLFGDCGHPIEGDWVFVKTYLRSIADISVQGEDAPQQLVTMMLSLEQVKMLLTALSEAAMLVIIKPPLVHEPHKDEL